MKKNRCTIVITGATKGIGRSLALEYAKPEVTLILIARNETELVSLSEECTFRGACAMHYAVDLSITQDALNVSSDIAKKLTVDLLISNAGVTGIAREGEIEPWRQIESIINVNCTGAIAISHSIISDMQTRKSGHVVYISSIAAYYGMPLTPAYCASKAALKAYAEAMRGLLASESINVTLVTPGFVETSMSQQFPSKKPFMINSTKAARVIKKGLDKKKRVISFPLPLVVGMKLLTILPAAFSDWILSKLKY